MGVGSCSWLGELDSTEFRGEWIYGKGREEGEDWVEIGVCRRQCAGNLCRSAITITSMLTGFGTRVWSVYAATLGLRSCTSKFRGGAGIGCLDRRRCRRNGAVASGVLPCSWATCFVWHLLFMRSIFVRFIHLKVDDVIFTYIHRMSFVFQFNYTFSLLMYAFELTLNKHEEATL